MSTVADLGDGDVGALGKQRIALQNWTDGGEIDRAHVVDEENGVRVADRKGDRIGQHRLVGLAKR